MTAFHLRLIAIVAMLIDHIGLFFFPDVLTFRIIGRLSFPLFAWLIANGYRHTKNTRMYMLRLFLFAAVSQIPFFLVNNQRDQLFFGLNIFFTLFLGLAAIDVYEKAPDKRLGLYMTLIFAVLAGLLRTDYGALGVLAIVSFHLSFRDTKKMVVLQSILFLLPYSFTLFARTREIAAGTLQWAQFIQPLALGALPLIASYNGQKGPGYKTLFYLFYPVHLLSIFLLKLWLA